MDRAQSPDSGCRSGKARQKKFPVIRLRSSETNHGKREDDQTTQTPHIRVQEPIITLVGQMLFSYGILRLNAPLLSLASLARVRSISPRQQQNHLRCLFHYSPPRYRHFSTIKRLQIAPGKFNYGMAESRDWLIYLQTLPLDCLAVQSHPS